MRWTRLTLLALLVLTSAAPANALPAGIDPIIETARLTHAPAVAGDQLGYSVAISGDGSTIVAGAPFVQAGGTNRGAVFVYRRPATGWTNSFVPTAILTKGANAANGDFFGTSVAISGDGATIVVGTPLDDAGMLDAGAAYVFQRPSGAWLTTNVPSARLTLGGSTMNDRVGQSVAISADGATIALGAPNNDTGGNERGAVLVYARNGANWANSAAPSATLTSNLAANGDHLGWSVAMSANGATIAAGAPDDDSGGLDRGAAYVFRRLTTEWTGAIPQKAKLTNSFALNDDGLGRTITLSDDGLTLVAGAPFDDSGGRDAEEAERLDQRLG